MESDNTVKAERESSSFGKIFNQGYQRQFGYHRVTYVFNFVLDV